MFEYVCVCFFFSFFVSNRQNCIKNSKVVLSFLELKLEKMMGGCKLNIQCQVHNLCCCQHISHDSSFPREPTPILRRKLINPIVNFRFGLYIISLNILF